MYLHKRARALTVALIALAAIAAAVYAVLSAQGPSGAASAGQAASAPKADPSALDALPAGGRMLVRAVDPRAPRRDGRVYELSASGMRPAGDLSCKRVYASPAGPGLCLLLADNGIDYDAVVFDGDHAPRRRFAIDGVPDRARVSQDGRYGAYTSFDAADSQTYFASSEAVSTNTRIVDMRTGRELLRLADLAVTRNGKPITAVGPRDLFTPQYWGVTFAGGDRFYATLGIGRDHHLIEGRVGERTARTIAERVECPALSPDGTRIAYKRRIGETNRWRLHVLDLATRRETPLAERRSIDDQPEWAGDDTVVYSDDKDVFAVPADGGGRPTRVMSGATSPGWLAGPG